MVVRGRHVELDGVAPARCPDRPGRARRARSAARGLPGPADRRAPAVPRRRRRLPRLRRRPRGRAPARRPARRPGHSRRGAVAHRSRHRVRPLPPAPLPDRERLPRPSAVDPLDARTTRAVDRLDGRVDELGPPVAVRAVAAARPTSSPSCRRSRSTMAGGLPRTAVEVARSTSSPATSSRSCSRSASTSTSPSTRSTCTACCARSTRRRTCTSCATPRSRSSARRPSRWCSCSSGRVISRPIAGTRLRGRTEEHDRRMAAELSEHPKERAEHVMLVDLARNDVGRVVKLRHRARRRADDPRALLARDAPHEPGRRASSPTAAAPSTCCARRSRRAR